MKYFTVLIASGTKNEVVDTFQAIDFENAIQIINQKYPKQAFRLFSGKSIPQKNTTIEKKKPSVTWTKNKK